ncbi:Hypothetical predicted protein, partial [Pelobates cultripes]
ISNRRSRERPRKALQKWTKQEQALTRAQCSHEGEGHTQLTGYLTSCRCLTTAVWGAGRLPCCGAQHLPLDTLPLGRKDDTFSSLGTDDTISSLGIPGSSQDQSMRSSTSASLFR